MYNLKFVQGNKNMERKQKCLTSQNCWCQHSEFVWCGLCQLLEKNPVYFVWCHVGCQHVVSGVEFNICPAVVNSVVFGVYSTWHTCCCQWCRRKDVQSRPRQPWCPSPSPRPAPPSSWRGPRCCRTAPPPSPRSPCGPPGGNGCPCTANRTALYKYDLESRRWLMCKKSDFYFNRCLVLRRLG